MSPLTWRSPRATAASTISLKTRSVAPSLPSLPTKGNLRLDRSGSPRPTRIRSPSNAPSGCTAAVDSRVVRNLYCGPSSASAKAVVTAFALDAGAKKWFAFTAYSIAPVSPSTTRIPQWRRIVSPLRRICSMRAPSGVDRALWDPAVPRERGCAFASGAGTKSDAARAARRRSRAMCLLGSVV